MNRLGDLADMWPQLNGLLDEALSLPPPQREGWLQALPAEHAALKDTLARLLDLRAGAKTHDFLGTLPKLGNLPPLVGPVPEARPPRSGDEVGPYRLLRELGEGGMGSVWLAERADGQLRRQVAVKLPRLSWARGLTERMARERDILAALEHPHIARLYDAGIDPFGRPWLALEYVDGQPIDLQCREQRLSVRDRVGLLLQVCAAVAYAHSRLIIHRDLKPSNILVTAGGEVRLLDFGVAKLLGDDRAQGTALTELVGRALTLRYASPEQVRGEPLTTASDVYSLGVVAYELLTGESPYRLQRASAAELESAILAAQAPSASTVAADPATALALRGNLDAVLAQALQKSPAQRYPTVQALADDLQRWLANEPVQARREPRRDRLLRTLRRHRLPIAAAAAVLVSLVGGISVALWQADIARSEARTAQSVQRFVEGILGASDPNQRDPARARERTARELMDIGARRIETELVGDPLAQARVMGMLAGIYDNMGEQGPSHRLRAQRVDLLARSGRSGTPEHLLALSELAISQERTGQSDAATRTLQQIEQRLATAERLDRGLRATVLVNIATTLDVRDPGRAWRVAREAAELLEPNGPPAALEAAWRKAGVAAVHAQAFDEARTHLRRARDLAIADGGMPANLADTMSFLGRAESALGNAQEARAALLEAVRLTELTSGPDSSLSMMAKLALASTLHQHGRLAEALDLYRQARTGLLRLPAQSRGADRIASVVTFEAGALRQFGHLEEGLRRIDEVLAGEEGRTVPAAHRIGLLNQRALLWIGAGQAGPAQRALLDAEQLIATGRLQDHPVAAAVQLARSRWLLLQGHSGEARDQLEQAVRQLDQVELAQASHPGDLTLAARIDIARRQWDPAVEWAQRALARTPGRGTDIGFASAEAWHALGAAHLGAGRIDDARRALERSIAQFEAMVDIARSPHLAEALADLGRALRLAGQPDEGRSLEQRARGMRGTDAARDPRLASRR